MRLLLVPFVLDISALPDEFLSIFGGQNNPTTFFGKFRARMRIYLFKGFGL